MADYQVTDDMIAKMKKGQNIVVQAINMQGTPISLPLPLNDFAKAYDGPPTDPKAFEEQQRKLQEELQKKAEEARKKLEGQQSQAPAAPAPALRPRRKRNKRFHLREKDQRRGLGPRLFCLSTLESMQLASCAAGSCRFRRARTPRRLRGWRIGLPDVSGSRFCSDT